jgi:putative chitinase
MYIFEKYKSKFDEYGLNTPLRIAHFMAQADAESGLVPKRESLYFKTVERLRKTFKGPFKNKSDSFVKSFLRNSEHCANYVYANRGGNGNQASGDGFKYRGGGIFQNTFKNGYKLLQEKTGIPFFENPDLILEEPNAVIAALEFWKANNLNKYADIDDLDAVSDQINIGKQTETEGDSNGYSHRVDCLKKWKTILKINY